ncbi:hypothetical protein H6G94_19245 [Nostoc punctiforme FACHB-252]|uniref:Uncharacterized protein n=1 Tax=Nostoc punctiforme FACHB-252 TaxID=1357509 RepID=A0ABR8HDJ2_NOSPU|nr:hypothetical protein [Nostoc punctiforme FACHB-252]
MLACSSVEAVDVSNFNTFSCCAMPSLTSCGSVDAELVACACTKRLIRCT